MLVTGFNHCNADVFLFGLVNRTNIASHFHNLRPRSAECLSESLCDGAFRRTQYFRLHRAKHFIFDKFSYYIGCISMSPGNNFT